MALPFPLWAAVSVFGFCEWSTVVVVARVSATVRHSHEPLVLLWVKDLLRRAAVSLGRTEFYVHPTSVTANLWKLWRRGVCALERVLEDVGRTQGMVYWVLETQPQRLWTPRGWQVPREDRAACLAVSPLAAHARWILTLDLNLHRASGRCRAWGSHVCVQVYELAGAIYGFPVYVDLRYRLRPVSPPRTPIEVADGADSEGDDLLHIASG